MQAIMESIFDIAYLVTAGLLGILILKNAKGKNEYILFGSMTLLLGLGDSFHLIARIYAMWNGGTQYYPVALGVGKLVTSITMTVFYILLYHFWQKHNHINISQTSNKIITFIIYGLAIARIGLCFFPQNGWFVNESSYEWGIYRNIPFFVMGGMIAVLYFKKNFLIKDRYFRFMWLAIAISFIFYIITVLGTAFYPLLGMLMIPKTCAYLWMIMMGYREVT